MSPTNTGLSVALRTYRQPSEDKQALNLLRHIPKCASMLSNFGGRVWVKLGRDKESCDMPDWAPGPDVGIRVDDVESLAAASLLLPPPAPLSTSAASASLWARSFCSSGALFRTSISSLSSCISLSLFLSLLSLSLSLCSLSLLTRSPQCFDQFGLTCSAFSHLYRLALAALTNRRQPVALVC